MTAVLIRVPHDEWEHEGTIGWEGRASRRSRRS